MRAAQERAFVFRPIDGENLQLGIFSIRLAVKDIAASRAFYEKHGFRAVRFVVSPPPESEPDVEYQLRP